MEKGQLSRDAFMQQIQAMTEKLVKKAKEYDRDTVPGDYATLSTPCPNCGGVVKENYRRSEEHTSELQSHLNLVCRLLLEKKKNKHADSSASPQRPNGSCRPALHFACPPPVSVHPMI